MITMWKPHKLSRFWIKTLFLTRGLGAPQQPRDLKLASPYLTLPSAPSPITDQYSIQHSGTSRSAFTTAGSAKIVSYSTCNWLMPWPGCLVR